MAIRNEPSLFSSIDLSKELFDMEKNIEKLLSDPNFIKLSMKGSLEKPYWTVPLCTHREHDNPIQDSVLKSLVEKYTDVGWFQVEVETDSWKGGLSYEITLHRYPLDTK